MGKPVLESGDQTLRTTAAALVVALLLTTAALTSPTKTFATVSTAKVVIVVGPTDTVTSTYRSDGDLFYNEAIKYTANVVKVYSPNATWAAVSAALQGASVVVYLGHGSGFPSPYSTTLNTSTEDGFGLNATAGNGDSNTVYYGEAYIRNYVHLAPNAVVIFNHACYTPGAASGIPDPTLSIAKQRIDNYASGFLAAGAAGVFATDYDGAQSYIDYLFGTSQTLDSMWRHASDAQGNSFSFASTRTPGTTDEADPTTTSTGPQYYRALSGAIATSTRSVVNPVPDTKPPTVTAPASRLYAGTTLGSTTTPARTSWSASDPSGIARYDVEESIDGGAFFPLLSTTTGVSVIQNLTVADTYRYGVRATDGAGNTSGWVYGVYFEPLLTQQSSSAVAYSGSWTSVSNTYASGGSLKYTTASGASATYSFTGSSVSWVSYRGPTQGSAKVYIDGVYKATVSLYATSYYSKQIVFAYNWAANGTHTIKIVCLGTSGHPRVDVDAFVRLVQL
jgi:hypothetical protein